jgi:hypothetical protein
MYQMVHVGHENQVSIQRIVGIKKYKSTAIRKLVAEEKQKGTLIDMTEGKRTFSVIYLDNGQIVTSSINPQTLAERIKKEQQGG